MGELSIAGLTQIFRTGWAVHGTLTIFDYVIGLESMSQQACKVVSTWHSKVGDTILGGQPTKLQDITTDHEQLDDCINILFAYDKDDDLSPSINSLFVSNHCMVHLLSKANKSVLCRSVLMPLKRS